MILEILDIVRYGFVLGRVGFRLIDICVLVLIGSGKILVFVLFII